MRRLNRPTGEIAELGRRLRGVRQRKGVSLRQASAGCDVAAATLSRLENGGECASGVLFQYAAYLGMKLIDAPLCEHEYICKHCGEASS